MTGSEAVDTKSISVAVRTLLAAGYIVTGGQRHPTHIEIPCHRTSRFGAELRFLVAISVADEFPSEIREDIRRAAAADLRVPIFVGSYTSELQLGWDDFMEAMGGAVPSWRALAPSFSGDLVRASRNELPTGSSGAAWAVFEDLVADGWEFCFGRRVRRLGYRRPGKIVSDMLAQLPDEALVVVDAKAAAEGFDATWSSLRPLAEYVKTQKSRQRGHNEVFGAVIVSSEFKQDERGLSDLANIFLSETSAALEFVAADVLSQTVTDLQKEMSIRNALRWRRLLSGGEMLMEYVKREIRDALSQRCDRGE